MIPIEAILEVWDEVHALSSKEFWDKVLATESGSDEESLLLVARSWKYHDMTDSKLRHETDEYALYQWVYASNGWVTIHKASGLGCEMYGYPGIVFYKNRIGGTTTPLNEWWERELK